MPKLSAGILLYRRRGELVEVFLVHPGGPFWKNKDEGAWSIPKGEYEAGSDPLTTARREFAEETGAEPPAGAPTPLGQIKQAGGKLVAAWALEGDLAAEQIQSNTFTIEWPPQSGKTREFPEVDRAGWFALAAAGEKILAGQREFLTRLAGMLDASPTKRPV